MSSYAKYSPAAAGGGSNVTNVTASAPIASSGGTTPNISLTGIVAVANGGTNSSTALANGKLMESSAGAIIESPVSISGNNVTLPGTLVSGNYHIEPAQVSQTASTGATTLDLSTAAAFVVTLGASTTLTLSNPQTGAAYVIEFIQGASAFTVTWPGTVKWPGGTAPIITTNNGAIDFIHLYWNGTIYIGSFVQNVQ